MPPICQEKFQHSLQIRCGGRDQSMQAGGHDLSLSQSGSPAGVVQSKAKWDAYPRKAPLKIIAYG
jgi:hypothetical protein